MIALLGSCQTYSDYEIGIAEALTRIKANKKGPAIDGPRRYWQEAQI